MKIHFRSYDGELQVTNFRLDFQNNMTFIIEKGTEVKQIVLSFEEAERSGIINIQPLLKFLKC